MAVQRVVNEMAAHKFCSLSESSKASSTVVIVEDDEDYVVDLTQEERVTPATSPVTHQATPLSTKSSVIRPLIPTSVNLSLLPAQQPSAEDPPSFDTGLDVVLQMDQDVTPNTTTTNNEKQSKAMQFWTSTKRRKLDETPSSSIHTIVTLDAHLYAVSLFSAEDHLHNLAEGNYGMTLSRSNPTSTVTSPKRRADTEYAILQIAKDQPRDSKPVIRQAAGTLTEDVEDEDDDVVHTPSVQPKKAAVLLQQLDVIHDPTFYKFAKEFRKQIVHV